MVSCNIRRSGATFPLFRSTRSESPASTVPHILLMVPLQTLKAARLPSSDTGDHPASRQLNLIRTTSRQSVQRQTAKYIRTTKRIFLDPLKIILYLRFPAVLITVYYSSITFGSLYILNISLQSTFSKPPYNFSTTLVGLTYIPNSIGYVLASFFGGKWTDTIMAREAKRAGRYDEKGKLMYIPEDRMRENAWIAAFLYPAALIWYGWTSEKGIFWLVPLSKTSPAPLFLCSSRSGAPRQMSRCSRAPPEKIKTDLEKYNSCQLLLRHRLHAHLRHGNNHAHRVHAQKGLQRRRRQQLHAQHLLVRGGRRGAAADRRHRQRVAVYGLGRHRRGEQRGRLGDEEVRAEMEAGDGERVG